MRFRTGLWHWDGRVVYVPALLLVVVPLAFTTGCASRAKPDPQPKPVVLGKPVIDFSKGGGGLPLEADAKPKSLPDLVQALAKGYALRVEMPQDKSCVLAEGSYPHLDLLRVDLTNGTVKDKYRPRFNHGSGKIEPAISARKFEYVATPLNYQHGQTQWNIKANDARLGIMYDGDGNHSLVLTDASEGSMYFSVKLAALKPMLLASAKTHAKGGFWVKDVDLKLTSSNPHEVEATMRVNALWLLVPTTFVLHGKAQLDSDCNVTLSDVHCQAEDVGGALVAGFVDSAIAKYNNRKMPLAAWPGHRIVLKDVALSVSDEIQFTAWFEGQGRVASR